METGAIPIEDLAGGIDLSRTLESGQTYIWRRADGAPYGAATGTDTWFETALPRAGDPVVIRIREHDGTLEWESTTDAVPLLWNLLRLDDDLPAIVRSSPADPLLDRAFACHSGMRLITDPPFSTLVSFIASAQMRVERIHRIVQTLASEYGTAVTVDGEMIHAFPTAEQLAGTTETALRDCGLGYRAPYVLETARMVASGEASPEQARDMDYEAARDYLTRFVGVGQKVADCVCLFALGHDEAVPLDTWIQSAIAEYYPECDRGSYGETSRAIRARFGGQYAGYAQTYVFHHLRTSGS